MYNLMSAAAAAGVNRSTVLRAIKAGRVSAQRDATGGWEIDPAEFHRVFPPLPLPAAASPQQNQQQIDAQVALLRNLIEQLRNDMEAREEDHRRREQDLRLDRDHWREAFQAAQRQLPAPAQPDARVDNKPGNRLQRAWRWMRATGCLAGAGLLFALSTVPAGAQQQQPQPQRECFTVMAANNPSLALNLGAILLDRCTGKTWLLMRSGDNKIRWRPITVDATEPELPPRG